MVLMLGVGGQGEEWGSEGRGELERDLTSLHPSPFSGPCVKISWANPSSTFVMAAAGFLPFPLTLPLASPRFLQSSAPWFLLLPRQIWLPTLTLCPHCHKECEPSPVGHKG